MKNALVLNYKNRKLRWNPTTKLMTVYSKGNKPDYIYPGSYLFQEAISVFKAAIKKGLIRPRMVYFTKTGNNVFSLNGQALSRANMNTGMETYLNYNTEFGDYILGLVLSKGKFTAK